MSDVEFDAIHKIADFVNLQQYGEAERFLRAYVARRIAAHKPAEVRLLEAQKWHKKIALLNPHPTDEPEWCCARIKKLAAAVERLRQGDEDVCGRKLPTFGKNQ